MKPLPQAAAPPIIMTVQHQQADAGREPNKSLQRIFLVTRTMLSALRSLTFLPLMFVFSACSMFTARDCVDIGAYAIEVDVRDSAGAPLSQGVYVVITDGPYSDSTAAPLPTSDGRARYRLGFERPGSYRVRVSAAGYATWERTGVTASRGGRCNQLQGVQLVAILTR